MGDMERQRTSAEQLEIGRSEKLSYELSPKGPKRVAQGTES